MTVKCSKDDVANAIYDKRCTPIVGNKLILDGLFRQRPLGPAWVECEHSHLDDPIDYPFATCDDLVSIAQYYAVKMGASVNAKRRYLQFLKSEYFKVHQSEYDNGRTFVPPAVLSALPKNTTFTQMVADSARHPTFTPEERLQPTTDHALRNPTVDAATPAMPTDDSWRNDPLAILAELPIEVFVTTSHHSLLEQALRAAGKYPAADVYQWMEGETILAPEGYSPVRVDRTQSQPPQPVEWGDFKPSEKTPLVCHLFGVDSFSNSLVLTEDDHIEFMLRANQFSMKSGDQVARTTGGDIKGYQAPVTDWLQGHVRAALATGLLLLVGYEIDGWDLRALLRGLILRVRSQAVGNREISVAVQMTPCNSARVRDEKLYQDYLEEYFGGLFSFKIFWQPAESFLIDLRNRIKGSG
jgi:hypothetical protein